MTSFEKDELTKSLLFEEYQVKNDLDTHVVKLQMMRDALSQLADCIQALISYTSSSEASGVTRGQAASYQALCSSMEIDALKRVADETLHLQDRMAELQSRKRRLRLTDTPC